MTELMTTYRRADLYEEVWTGPVRTVAQRYGVSDVALRKICQKLRVPLPGRGHWARVRAGHGDSRPVLGAVGPNGVSEIVSEPRSHRDPRPTRPAETSSEPAIVVPAELRNPHPLVLEASRLLRGRKPSDGLVRCWGTSCLDITVAPASLGRALRIMHALIRELEKRGLKVEVTRPLSYEQNRDRGDGEAPSNATRVSVSGEWIQFGLTEKRTAVLPPAPEVPKHLRGPERESWIWAHQPRKELVPNGVLELAIKSSDYLPGRKLWHDGKRTMVEECLNDFVARLSPVAETIKQHRAETERRRLEYAELERKRFEDERRRAEQAGREERFRHELARWRLARDVREYIAEIRALVADGGESIADECLLGEKLKWAEAYVNRIDPVTRIRAKCSVERGLDGSPEASCQNGPTARRGMRWNNSARIVAWNSPRRQGWHPRYH